MDEKPIIETSRHIIAGAVLSIIWIALTAAFLWHIYLYIYLCVHGRYIYFGVLILAIVCGLLSSLLFGIFYFPNSLDRLMLYDDRLEIYPIMWFRRRTIMLSDITSWSQYIYNGRMLDPNGISNYFVIYTTGDYYKINPKNHEFYDELKERLTAGKRQVVHKDKSILAYAIGGFFLLMGLGIMAMGINAYAKKDIVIKPEDLTNVRDVLSKVDITHGKGGATMTIYLQSYPAIRFDFDRFAYRATRVHNFLANVRTGDSVYVNIMTSDYQKIAAKDISQNFLGNIVVSVYELRDNHSDIYLSLEGYQAFDQTSEDIMPMVVGLFFSLLALSMIRGNYRLRNTIES